MIDIEAGIARILRHGGGYELTLVEGPALDIVATAYPVHARYARKVGTGPDVEMALLKVAERIGVELPIRLLENLCDICGLELEPDKPYDGHPECREQE